VVVKVELQVVSQVAEPVSTQKAFEDKNKRKGSDKLIIQRKER
jgi:hypothetical protein